MFEFLLSDLFNFNSSNMGSILFTFLTICLSIKSSKYSIPGTLITKVLQSNDNPS